MKTTSFIINTSRGHVVDEKDLAWALDGAVIAGAALDVFSDEPLKSDSPLFDCPNILLTPHCGPSWRRRHDSYSSGPRLQATLQHRGRPDCAA